MKETFTPPSTKTISNLLTADLSGTEKWDVGNESEGGGMLSLASSPLGCCRSSLQRKMTEGFVRFITFPGFRSATTGGVVVTIGRLML